MLAETFARFSQIESPQMSPLYSRLAAGVSNDPEILAIAGHVRPGQPPANMLFGAVRMLLERGTGPSLFPFYPDGPDGDSSDGQPDDTRATGIDSDAYAAFRQFALGNQDAIRQIISSRSVQSNVVRRSAVLLLGLLHISESVDERPLVNFEIGSSLGLTLLWDLFDYDYGDGRLIGPADSPVKIATRLANSRSPIDSGVIPAVIESIGIERDFLNVDSPDDLAWLNSLIWPEHCDNRQLSVQAIELLRVQRPRVIEGDALDVLPSLIAEQEAGAPVVIYHSHTLNQMSAGNRRALDDMLLTASSSGGPGASRPVFRLAFEGDGGHSALRLFEYSAGTGITETHLANCEPHGRWIEWLANRP